MEEEQKESKGLWQQMQESKNVVKWPPEKPLTIQDIRETFELLYKQDIERRERMDKEYTDINKITLQEINNEIAKWNGDVPNGLFCKVKIAGSYQEWPIKALQQWLEALEQEVKKYKDGK